MDPIPAEKITVGPTRYPVNPVLYTEEEEDDVGDEFYSDSTFPPRGRGKERLGWGPSPPRSWEGTVGVGALVGRNGSHDLASNPANQFPQNAESVKMMMLISTVAAPRCLSCIITAAVI